MGARVPAGAWCAARQSAGAGPGRAGGRWAEGGVTWQGELVASGSAAPCHLLAQAARASSPPRASTGSPAKRRGRRTGAGRRAPGRVRVVSPRGNLRCGRAGGNEGWGRRESVASRAQSCGGRSLARCPPRRAPPTARQGPRNFSAFHARVPAPETAQRPWPGPRWPRASLALAACGVRPVPVTHLGARAALGAREPRGGGRGKVGYWRCGTATLTSLRPSALHVQNHQARTVFPISQRRRPRPGALPDAKAYAARRGTIAGLGGVGRGGGMCIVLKTDQMAPEPVSFRCDYVSFGSWLSAALRGSDTGPAQTAAERNKWALF